MEKAEPEAETPNFGKLKTSVGNLLPLTAEAWLPIGLALRGSFVASLLSFFALLALSYGLWATIFLVVVEDFPGPLAVIGVLAALSVQAVYGGTYSVSRSDPLGIVAIETKVDLVAFPSLLTIAVVIVAVLSTRKILRTLSNHRPLAAVLLPLGFTATSVILFWVLGFITNRYAVFPVGSEFSGFFISTMSFGNVLAIAAITYVPALVAGIFLLKPDSGFNKLVGWFLRTLRTFFFVVLVLGFVATIVNFLYSLLSVEFGVAPTPDPIVEPGWAITFGAIAVLLIFLPTIVLNSLWLVSGSEIGLQVDSNSMANFLNSFAGDWLSDIFFLVQSYSLWDENPWLAAGALIVLLATALYSGAISANYSKYHPRSFWGLAILAALALVTALALRWLSSAQISVSARIDGDIPEGFDSSDYLSEAELLGFSVSLGVSELAVIALSLGVVVSAFLGARYLANWIPGIFPRFASKVSLQKASASPEEASSEGQKWVARGLIAAALVAAIGSISLAAAERIVAIVDSPERYVNGLAQGLLSDSIADRKEVFSNGAGSEWLPDEALSGAGAVFQNGFEVKIRDASGGDWQAGGLATMATIKSIGDQKVEFSFPVKAEVIEYPLGFERAVFSGSPDAPTIGLELPAVLADAGVQELQVEGVAIKPATYLALPGDYEVVTEGRGIVSGTEQTVSVGNVSVSLQIAPEVILPRNIDSELSARLDLILAACSDFDARGASECFSVAEERDGGKSLEGPPPVEYFDFVISGDFDIEFLDCEEPTDRLDSAFSLTRTQSCAWNVDVERTYFDTRVVRTPTYGTETYSTWNSQCRWEYSEWFDWGYWTGCYVDQVREVQTGTTTSYVRGAEIFRSIFRSEILMNMSVSVEYRNDILQVSEPSFARSSVS